MSQQPKCVVKEMTALYKVGHRTRVCDAAKETIVSGYLGDNGSSVQPRR